LIGRFPHQGVTAKASDFRIDRDLDVLNGGLDTRGVVRVKAGLDDFVL